MNDAVKAGQIAVSLEGDQIDLNDACIFFADGRHGISVKRMMIQNTEKVVLFSDILSSLSDDAQRIRAASRIIDTINGILFLDDANRKPISMAGSLHEQHANGNWSVTIMLKGISVRARAGFISTNLQPEAGTTKQSDLLGLAIENDDVEKVLEHLRDVPDWVDLYKAYEIMREDMAKRFGKNPPQHIDWPNKAMLDPFTADAQFFRHSHRYKHLPKREASTAMSIHDARAFLQSLCKKWLGTFEKTE